MKRSSFDYVPQRAFVTPLRTEGTYGITVGGVGVKDGRSVSVGTEDGVGVDDGVNVMRGVRVGRGVAVDVDVGVGVRVGANTRVGVTSASIGYSSCMAEYQFKPLVNAYSVKRAPL